MSGTKHILIKEGGKGDPFVYADFTQEQLDKLKGVVVQTQEPNRDVVWIDPSEDPDVIEVGDGLEWDEYTQKSLNKNDRLVIYDPSSQSTFYTTVDAINAYIQSRVPGGGTGGSGVTILIKNGTVPSSDTNVFSSLRTEQEIEKRAISKTKTDIAEKLIKFTEGIDVGNYTDGTLGGGGTFRMKDGKSELEVDKLTVRMESIFTEVFNKRAQHVAGELIVSPADMIVTDVEDRGAYYRCYFNDNGDTVPNTFVIGDLARLQVNKLDVQQVIKEISYINDVNINVSFGTARHNITFPTKVLVTYKDNSTENRPVVWGDGIPAYNGLISGVYNFIGVVSLGENTSNPDNLYAQAIVQVQTEILYVVSAPDIVIPVAYGTPFEDIPSNRELPVFLSDGSTRNLFVSFANIHPPYSPTVVGRHTAVGAIQMVSGIINPNNIRVYQYIDVEEDATSNRTISSAQSITIGVPLNYEFSELPLPATAQVKLDDNSNRNLSIDITVPVGFDNTTEGKYTTLATIQTVAGITNPNDIKAEIIFKVGAKEIQSVAPISIEVEYDTILNSLPLPKSVPTVYTDGSTGNSPVLWDEAVPVYDRRTAGVYTFLGKLQSTGSISNFQNHTVQMSVTVKAGMLGDVPAARTQFIADNNIGLGRNLIKDPYFRDGSKWDIQRYNYNGREEGRLMIVATTPLDYKYAEQSLVLIPGTRYYFKINIETVNVISQEGYQGGAILVFTNTDYNSTSIRVSGTTADTTYTGSFICNLENVVFRMEAYRVTTEANLNNQSNWGKVFFSKPILSTDPDFTGSIFGTEAEVLNEAKHKYPLNSDYGLPAKQTERVYSFEGVKVYQNQDNIVIEGKEFGHNATGKALAFYNCQNVTIRNCKFAEVAQDDALVFDGCNNILVEHCEFINIHRGARVWRATHNVMIRENHFTNVLGRLRGGAVVTCAIQFAHCNGTNLKIIDNSCETIPGMGVQDDTINIFYSFGTEESPIEVRGNWCRGHGDKLEATPTGGGILIGDYGGKYQISHENICVDTGNYGMGLAGGQFMTMKNNTVYGVKGHRNTLGLSVWDFTPPTSSAYLLPQDIYVFGNKVHRRHYNGSLKKVESNQAMRNAIPNWNPDNLIIFTGDETERVLPPNIMVRFPVEPQGNLTVTSVEPISLTVPHGTLRGDLNLPSIVNVRLSDNSTRSMAVTFGGFTPTYNGNSDGTYTVNGTLTLPQGVTNPNNVTVATTVVVQAEGNTDRQDFIDLHTPNVGRNLIVDSTFIQGFDNWWQEHPLTGESVVDDGIVTFDASLRTGDNIVVSNLSIPVTPLETYTFSVRGTATGVAPELTGMIFPITTNEYDEMYDVLSSGLGFTATEGWSRKSVTFTVPVGITQVNVSPMMFGSTSGTASFEKPQLEVGTSFTVHSYNSMDELLAEADRRFS